MILLRSLLFQFLFYSWTGVSCLLLLGSLILPRRVMMVLARGWLVGIAFLERSIIGLKWQVLGRCHVPTEPFILAAKHQSVWETLKLNFLLADPAIVLKKELMAIPVFGWYLAKARMIPVNRAGHAKALATMLQCASNRVAEGRSIVIFPQGTRTAPGTHYPYQVGVAALYLKLKLPVVPLALNSGLFWGRRWFHKKPGTITVEFLPPILPGLNRTELMVQLEAELEAASKRLEAIKF